MLLPLALMLALTAADPSLVELESTTLSLAPHDYRYVDARIANWPATIICRMSVADGGPVGVELLTREDLNRYIRDKPHGFIVSLDPRMSGDFRQSVSEKGDYAFLLTNGGDRPSIVRFEAAVQFAREPDVAKYLPSRKRLMVITISLAVFLAIVSWSTWKLAGAIRRI